jgi:RimJ/RimL family protein N-acetyltransferase
MMSQHPTAPYFPPARIRVVTPRLELRLPNDHELMAVVDVALDGIHDPSVMPFATPWSDSPREALPVTMLQWNWSQRASFAPEKWNMLLGVFVDGNIVGMQDLAASSFGVRREVDSGSWLGQRHHGRGIGTEMREAMLHLAFEGLGAQAANSGYVDGNAASQRVSEKVGYERNGVRRIEQRRGPTAPGGETATAATEVLVRLTRESWLSRRRSDIELQGVDDELLALVGAT